MQTHFKIGDREIGPGRPVFIIAEMSANHNRDFKQAVRIIEAAVEAGADAIKLQTYTPDTLTIDCDNEHFKIGAGTIWEGRTLYDLYGEAYTPWEWQPDLKKEADRLGIILFSTPFDSSAVDFLERMDVPAHKIASFEIVDLPLVRKVAAAGKPVIISTGMATLGEIEEAVNAAADSGANSIALLKCTSAYPAPARLMNLKTIPHLARAFGLPVGLSDHTMGAAIPVAAVTLGACIIEKHFTLSRDVPGPDSAFSLQPAEFKAMVEAIRGTEQALGEVAYGASEPERASMIFRRSLFVVEDLEKGRPFSEANLRSIRPGYGLHTRYLPRVLGRKASCSIKRGTPLSWELVGEK